MNKEFIELLKMLTVINKKDKCLIKEIQIDIKEKLDKTQKK